MNPGTCSRCGSSELETGQFQTTAQVQTVIFRPANAKFFTLKMGVPVEAIMCLNCGLIQLEGNPAELKELLKPKQA